MARSCQRLVKSLVPFLLIGWVSLAWSEENTRLAELESRVIKGPTVADLVAHAYLANPSIHGAHEAWKAVVERYRVATAYPDPQLMFSYSPQPVETRLGPSDWKVSLSQAIPFPGKLSKAGEVVRADARMARLNLDKVVRDVIVKILESYHELLYISRAKKVLAENLDLLNHLRKIGETAYAQDRATLVDVLKAQSQLAQVQYDAVLLEEIEQTEKTQLNAVLNRPPGASIGPLIEEPLRPVIYDLEEIYRMASEFQEEIQMAETRINRAMERLDLALYENLPEFKVGFSYTGIGDPDVPIPPPEAGQDALSVQFGVTIPLWPGKNAGRRGEARAELQRARADKMARVNETNAQIRNVFFRLHNAERLVKLYRDQLLPQAAESMEIAETWFREKQGSFSDFLETESVFYNFQLALARAKADYGQFLARLERLVGRSLTQRVAGAQEKRTEGGSP